MVDDLQESMMVMNHMQLKKGAELFEVRRSMSASVFPAKPEIHDMCYHDGYHGRYKEIELVSVEHLLQEHQAYSQSENKERGWSVVMFFEPVPK